VDVPVYEYACTECGERLEVKQSFTDNSLTECPACSGRLRKVLSPVGVVFKGSGFYRNDSRKGSGDSTDKKDKKTADSGSTKESSSSGSSGSGSSASDGGSTSSGSDPKSSGSATKAAASSSS
jgi:putative FmdB family regulatory protein